MSGYTVRPMLKTRPATLDDAAALVALLARCRLADGYGALSEFKALRVPVANGARSIVAVDADKIVAVAVAAWHPKDIGETGGYWAAEMALDPPSRSVVAYTTLLAAMKANLGRAPALWTFSADQVAAARLSGMAASRTLVEMRRQLPAPNGQFPADVSIRGFVPGADEEAWLALNHEVFAHHPEASSIDGADLALRMAQPWFDPAGLLMLMDRSESVGYCWTKMHSDEVGEIYMVGLKARYRGTGLARQLTLAGLDYLASHGATTAMLYAEASNSVATGLYESMGFEVRRRITLYEPEGHHA
jgi:mycothiol synthase